MAAPQLVIADAPYKQYPGGIIVLRAADWLAGARGTLSTEADARSCCGTVVRDSQKVTTSIYATQLFGNYAAFQEAEDTLVINLAGVPIEPGISYTIFVSLLMEGDWDPTNQDTIKGGAHQEVFAYAANLGYYGVGDGLWSSDNDAKLGCFLPRGLDTYRVVGWGVSYGTDYLDGDEVFHFRAYAQNGTTIEFLLDQIYLVPTWFQTGSPSPWTNNDFQLIQGDQGTFGSYNLDPADGPPDWIDGVDGGDNQGKFTWHPYVFDSPTTFKGEDAGGDYQRVADSNDAEYMIRVLAADGYFLRNSVTNMDGASVCYGVHGPFFVPQQTWVNDDFTRTVSDGDENGADDHFLTGGTWGIGPQGFAWSKEQLFGPHTSGVFGHRHGRAAYTDGNRGCLAIRTDFQDEIGRVAVSLLKTGLMTQHTNYQGAEIRSDNLRFSGHFTYDLDVLSDGGGSDLISVALGIRNTGDFPKLKVFLYPTQHWQLVDADNTVVASGTNPSVHIGWRIEVLRYRLRMRIWDAGGAEPGAWDYDGFRALAKPAGLSEAYDYGDDLEVSTSEVDELGPRIQLEVGGVTMNGVMARVFFDDITVENDPIGDLGSAFASIEKPEGVQLAQIEMPGPQHLVYWGRRAWTTTTVPVFPDIEFSAKVWNAPGAAEMQRSEARWWWFRVVRLDLIPMNWRSADRSGHPWRVLSG